MCFFFVLLAEFLLKKEGKTDDGNADGLIDALGRKFYRAFFFVDDVLVRPTVTREIPLLSKK